MTSESLDFQLSAGYRMIYQPQDIYVRASGPPAGGANEEL
jgi:hypothetical protein